jgi:hypothetical protein
LPLIAIALSLPGSSIFGLIVLWLTITGTELGLWRLNKDHSASKPALRSLPASLVVAPENEPLTENSWNASETLDAAATQKLIYRSSTDGKPCVQGWLRASFVADQRTAIIHTAFCPAFEQTPSVEAEPIDGPLCEVRPTLVLPWGVRWEVKLDSPATASTSVALEFIAQETD